MIEHTAIAAQIYRTSTFRLLLFVHRHQVNHILSYSLLVCTRSKDKTRWIHLEDQLFSKALGVLHSVDNERFFKAEREI